MELCRSRSTDWKFPSPGLNPWLLIMSLNLALLFDKIPMMEREEQEKDAMELPQEKPKNQLRNWQRCLPLWVVLVLLSGASAITWYFLDYRPRHLLELNPLHFYSGSLKILNRQYSLDHGRMESRAFWTETTKAHKMLKDLIHATDVAPYYNSSSVYAFGEGSLTCFFWFALRFPTNQHEEMTAEKVKAILYKELLINFNKTDHISYQTEYRIDPKSLLLLAIEKLDHLVLRKKESKMRWSYMGQSGYIVTMNGVSEDEIAANNKSKKKKA
ncbi:hypothetical protein JD844_028397 [Phrynosoma platyrhinos]|uniref:SEA domain-containing protein n=1 Tax=Phrynosoma platyrhinos TaxID=52577 RepID=A0ABQ7SHU8_PHRPL|nr:hypothetical protein JD844_028397 [Phrynosoma platyrhinos]